MNRLLITGGAGFIGTNFVYFWHSLYPEDRLVILDALTYAGNLDNLKPLLDSPKIRFINGDIRDQHLIENIQSEENFNIFVNFAAESHVDRSITGPDAFLETNVMGTHTLLKVAKSIGSKNGFDSIRFHHVSTDEVYGTLKPDAPPFTEKTAYAPNSPYSASKAASDHIVRAYNKTYGLDVTFSNCSNNYGPYQFPEKLIPLCLTNILDGEKIPVYGDGKQIRDWLYVEDHCRGIEQVIKKGKSGSSYNIGGNNEWYNIDIVKLLCDIIDHRFKTDPSLADRFPCSPSSKKQSSHELISFITDRPGHDRRYSVNTEKISRELKFAPKETFMTGIEKTVDWYLANEQWWRTLKEKMKNSI